MKINTAAKVASWKEVLDSNVQVDSVAVPTGKFHEIVKDDRISKVYETEDKICFGFQTESGRGKGIQWVPVNHVDSVLETLMDFALNPEKIEDSSDAWPDPVQTIKETITRTPALDEDGNPTGKFNVSFRVRAGKGSKSITIPAEDFLECRLQLRPLRLRRRPGIASSKLYNPQRCNTGIINSVGKKDKKVIQRYETTRGVQ